MRNVMITGANSGLGYETARKVASQHGYKVILACRNLDKARAAKEKIIEETGNPSVEIIHLDTSSLDSVRKCAKKYISRGEPLYALVNNAGISSMGHAGTTSDGFDLVFETNYLGAFLLTELLLPIMEEKGRIYNISSDMHNPPGGIKWHGVEDIAHPKKNDRKSYSYSKLCMLYMTYELDRKLKAEGKEITVNAFNPGYMGNTNFMKMGKFGDEFVKHTMPNRYGNLAESSDALAKLITGDEFETISGKYFDRGTDTAESSELSYSTANAEELWNASLKYVGID